MMRRMKLAVLWMLPWITRYFVVSNATVDHIEPAVATLIRKKGRYCSYLYLSGALGRDIERIPDTDFSWGPWLTIDMRRGEIVCREIDELEAYVMIRRAAAAKKTW